MAIVIRATAFLLLALWAGLAPAGPPEQQVALDVKFIVVHDRFIKDLGVDWRGLGSESQAASDRPNPGTTLFPAPAIAFFSDLQAEAVLRAAGELGGTSAVSAPKVTVGNGRPAVIRAAGDVAFQGQRYRDVGLQLTVTPTVTPDSLLQLGIDVGSTELLPLDQPVITTRRVQTDVELRAGQTLAIGGLVSDQQAQGLTKIPGLVDLDMIGGLLSVLAGGDDGAKRELLVTVTPRLAGVGAASGDGPAAHDGNGRNAPAAGGEPAATGTTPGGAGGGSGETSTSQGGGAPDRCFSGAELGDTDLGPKPGSLGNAAKSLAKGLAGALLGGGGGKSSSKVRTSRNPFKKAESFDYTDPEGGQFALQARGDASKRKGPVDGTLFGVQLGNDTVKDGGYLFTDVMLVDRDCKRHHPVARYVYKVWQKMRLTVTVSFWKWRDGQLVDHWTRSGSQEWNRLLGSGGGAYPTWVGARFDVTPSQLAEGGYTLVTACTIDKGDSVVVRGQGFDIAGDREQVDRVPGLGDVPTLAPLFRADGGNDAEKELVIFMTPRILRDVD